MRAVRRRADLLVALGILALHAVAIWGYTGTYRGDHGRWLHEVERFAQGQAPYHDFQWHFPPLGIWVVGSLANLVGTDLLPVYLITTSIAALLVAAVVLAFRELMGRSDTLLLAAMVILAISYVQRVGVPLTYGAYTPSSPIGFLCLTTALVFFLREWTAGKSGRDAWWLGVFAGLAVLSKQDFWLPSAFLVGVSVLRFRRAAPVLASGAVVVLGTAIVVRTAGFSVLPGILSGFHHAQLRGARGFPSWERVTVECISAGLVTCFLTTMLSVARRKWFIRPLVVGVAVTLIGVAIHLTMSMSFTVADLAPVPQWLTGQTDEVLSFHIREGHSLFRPALGWLRERVVTDPLPLLLYLLLLITLAWRWAALDRARRVKVALLVGFAILLRGRRAFEHTEWFEFLVTVPVVLLAFELLSGLEEGALRRFRIATGGVLLGLSLLAYYNFSRGLGTGSRYPVVQIARGTVRWAPNIIRDYQDIRAALDSIDPARSRPLLGYGYTGGWNYYLQRRNPFPITQDFVFSAFDADSLVKTRPPHLFLIDVPLFDATRIGTFDIRFDKWEQPTRPSVYLTFDRPRFDRLREGCQQVDRLFVIYVCP